MKHVMIASVFALWIGVVSSPAQQTNTAVGSDREVRPTVTALPLSGSTVTDLHLRPMFTTTIRLPEAVTSVAVGAPTLFEVEHSDQEPRLVFVKPSTKDAATSNLIIALESGQLEVMPSFWKKVSEWLDRYSTSLSPQPGEKQS